MKKYYIVFLAKVALCIGVFFVLFKRSYIFPFLDSSEVLSELSTIITSIIGSFIIYFFYRSIAEVVDQQIKNSEEERRKKPKKSKDYTLDNLIKIIQREDIVDIEIISISGIIKIGASSDYDNRSDKFFDKLYYINDKEYRTIEEFNSALIPEIINTEAVPVTYLE